MGNYSVGKLIAEMRKRKGISQEELAGLLCSVSTISKIENGQQLPSRKLCEGLLQKLGLSDEVCNHYLGESELEKSVLEEQIRQNMRSRNCEETGRLLKRYEQLTASGKNRLEQQFLWTMQGCLLLMKGRNLEQAQKIFLQALALTMPKFTPQKIASCHLLMEEELLILQKLAELTFVLGNPKEGKQMLFFLKYYLEQGDIDARMRKEHYPDVVLVLARWMEHERRFSEEFDLCECGLKACQSGGCWGNYPVLLEAKGYALIGMNRMDEAAMVLKQACIIFQSIGEPIRVGLVKNKSRLLFQNYHRML